MNRKLFYAGNFLILGLFLVAVVQDNEREWKDYQKEYKRLEIERVSSQMEKAQGEAKEALGRELKTIKQTPIALRQIMAKDLGRFDRCISCHTGFDPVVNPTLTTPYKEHPFKAPEIAAHKAHDISKIGCTSCHSGQGLATTVEAAHGWVPHWEEPMLGQPYMQGMCVRCHEDFEGVKGLEGAARGKQLVAKLGCVGCHSFRGVGGEVSVDLGDIADKPVARIHWGHAHLARNEWNVKNWIELHLTKDPLELVPGDPHGELCSAKAKREGKCEPISPSGMPPFFKEISKEDAAAITAYLMSMTENLPPAHLSRRAAPKPEPKFASAKEHGKFVFEKYGCAACHGEGGAKGRRNFNARCDGQEKMEDGCEPTLTKVIGTYSREELKEKLWTGVAPSAVNKFNASGPTPPLYMPSWKAKIKGQELEDLMTYLFSIAEKQEEW